MTGLQFNQRGHVVKEKRLAGAKVTYRLFPGIVYVENPVDAPHQAINIFAPETYFHGGVINGYDVSTAPIFPPNLVGGYMSAKPGGIGSILDRGHSIFQALRHGYVVATPGLRGSSRSSQHALDSGIALPKWIPVQDGVVTNLPWDTYVAYATRKKTSPAFDDPRGKTPENQVFGTKTILRQHFTAFGVAHDQAGIPAAEPDIVALLNPMNHIGAPGATTATHWRIRHGTIDRDTSLPIPILLAAALKDQGCQVNLALPWDTPHSGNYDLPDLFTWIDQITSNAV